MTFFFQWEFDYIDKDNNTILDTAEIDEVFDDALDFEPCLYGFLKSCDQNGREGIDKREWDFCFPVTGNRHINKLSYVSLAVGSIALAAYLSGKAARKTVLTCVRLSVFSGEGEKWRRSPPPPFSQVVGKRDLVHA